jgi:hypothetical protein
MSDRIVIIGAGAAGVFTAYRLREMYGPLHDIVLLERSNRVGGNTYSTTVEYGGRAYNIDCGAQFFYKNPQASYVELLEQIGLFDADDDREIFSAPAGFTIWDRAADRHLFHIPSRMRGFARYDAEDWERLIDFGIYLGYSYFLDRTNPANWALSVDDWLAGLHLVSPTFKTNVIKNFMYQFVSLPLSRIGEASALYAVTYFVRNVFGEPRVDEPDPEAPELPGLPVFETYQSAIGLDGVLKRVLAVAGVEAQLGTGADAVIARADGELVVRAGSGEILADHVVFACDPGAAAEILAAGGTAPAALVDTLRGLDRDYVNLPISMQKNGTCDMPADPDYWQPVNTIVDGDDVVFSAWFGPLRPKYDGDQQIPVFKSWGARSLTPPRCAHEFLAHEHRILLPTTRFVGLRDQLVAEWQGRGNVWFTGGWTNWFDSQEAALDSATSVADALPFASRPHTGPARMVPIDHARTERNLRRWLERMARHAPPDKRGRIGHALEEVESRG